MDWHQSGETAVSMENSRYKKIVISIDGLKIIIDFKQQGVSSQSYIDRAGG